MDQDYYSNSSYSLPTWAIVLICVVGVIEIIGMWKTFVKAGQPGWACIIPIYNVYIMTKIGGKPAIWTLWCFLLPIVFMVWVYNMISKSFGKDEGFTVGIIFLPFIFWPILGFGDAKYQGPYGKRNRSV